MGQIQDLGAKADALIAAEKATVAATEEAAQIKLRAQEVKAESWISSNAPKVMVYGLAALALLAFALYMSVSK